MKSPLGSLSLGAEDTRWLAAELAPGGTARVASLGPAALAYTALALQAAGGAPAVWVVESAHTLETFHQDLLTLAGGAPEHLLLYPAHERHAPPGPAAAERAGDRLRTLQQLAAGPGPALVATCIQALFQAAPSAARLRERTRRVAVGDVLDREEWLAFLERVGGYGFGPEVHERGQAAVRGGLVDIWSPTEPWPVRLEFWGPRLESMRAFDPETQRSREPRGALILAPAAEDAGAEADLAAHVPAGAVWAWIEPDRLREHAALYLRMADGGDQDGRGALAYDRLRAGLRRAAGATDLVVGLDADAPGRPHELGLRPCEGLPALADQLPHPDVMERLRRECVEGLRAQAARGRPVHVFFPTAGALERFREMYGAEPLRLHHGALSEGFTVDAGRLTVVTEADLFGFARRRSGRAEVPARREGAARIAGPRLADWTDLQPGELVVHADHGIGRYLGLYEIAFQGRPQEVLTIEYADQAKLHVPVAQAHLLSRYIGAQRALPNLHALGGKRWQREKTAAARAVADLAAALLQVQAARAALPGHAFPPDTAWQREFEAAFPYQETADQQRAIEEVKRDMESSRPMDRLVCGDVGYGKTEVAMRAAFKAVTGGRQVALLVPTTILAQQHYDTFAERMAAYPVAIEMLSRFRSRAEQAEIVRRLAEGGVDIVIGTHRLLQGDVRFKDLGLVIIDEEQRFGVRHKEHLKQLRQLVDVLTLTATPIPRTLYLGLTGARDMSTIQTPPQERLPVETVIAQHDDALVRDAILRELDRGGQVFYLHNRVHSIRRVEERLRQLVPEARTAVGHGRMREQELANVMHRFVRGEFDVLLCTTIIESGVDIPNVNTILIDRADRFGMADLYQLRGRVGRYKHKAYAYLLLPRHGRLFDAARRRMGAIRRYSSLGAGFKLALRDLEIRGAGNVLGAEQSGHIAAIGFDLYCQLLRRTVAGLKGEPVPPVLEVEMRLDFIDHAPAHAGEPGAAVIPPAYVEDENLRLQAYRRLAGAATEAELDEIRAEFSDRFGPPPPALERLLLIARVRMAAAAARLASVEVQGEKVLLQRDGDYVTRHQRLPRLPAGDPGERLAGLLRLVRLCAAG